MIHPEISSIAVKLVWRRLGGEDKTREDAEDIAGKLVAKAVEKNVHPAAIVAWLTRGASFEASKYWRDKKWLEGVPEDLATGECQESPPVPHHLQSAAEMLLAGKSDRAICATLAISPAELAIVKVQLWEHCAGNL